MKLMELKEKTVLSREEAAARLHAIADKLASGNDVVLGRGICGSSRPSPIRSI